MESESIQGTKSVSQQLADCQFRCKGLRHRIQQLEAEVERLQSSGDRAAELIEGLEPHRGNLRFTPPDRRDG